MSARNISAMAMEWWEYVQRHAGRDTQNKDIAAAVGCHPSQISRWAQGEQPRATSVVSFARAYNRPPVEALIAAGYLELDEVAGAVQIQTSPHDLSSEELAAEFVRRSRLQTMTPEEETPKWRGPGPRKDATPP